MNHCGECGQHISHCNCVSGWLGLMQWGIFFAILIAVVSIIR